jgi:hypothetical protein
MLPAQGELELALLRLRLLRLAVMLLTEKDAGMLEVREKPPVQVL